MFVLDNNAQQALGFTQDIIKIEAISEKMQSFGFNVLTIDGHNQDDIKRAFLQVANDAKPGFINAKTILGKGVDFMEGTIEWHYKSLTEAQYESAMEQLL